MNNPSVELFVREAVSWDKVQIWREAVEAVVRVETARWQSINEEEKGDEVTSGEFA